MVLEMLVFSRFNQSTWLVAQEDFIIQSRSESYKSYNPSMLLFATLTMRDSDKTIVVKLVFLCYN
jgi:hypothetical protein